jgi:hypothetical protein
MHAHGSFYRPHAPLQDGRDEGPAPQGEAAVAALQRQSVDMGPGRAVPSSWPMLDELAEQVALWSADGRVELCV